MKAVAIMLVAASIFFAGKADACRCAQQNLADYFDSADTVIMGRLQSVSEADEQRRLGFELLAPSYKGGHALRAGDTLAVVTAASTASCGIQPALEAIYVVFAYADDNDALRVDSCSGTRVHLPADGGDAAGFADVPPRFVAQQLNGLAGAELLRAVAANAPQPHSPANESLVGLLDLAPLAHGGHVLAYLSTDASQAPLSRIEQYDDVENREYDYELPAAVVYAVLPDWYRLRLADDRFVFVQATEAGTFFPYPDIAINRLNYLTENWSGFVWPSPGAGLPMRDSRTGGSARAEYPTEVHEATVIGGMPFLRVTVFRNEPCSGGEQQAAFSGWIPAFGPNGGPTAWFWSRGC